MKKLLLVAMVVVGAISYGRDFEHNERRDILEVSSEQVERMSRFTEEEWNLERSVAKENLENYMEFHKELETMDRGHENK